jgi:lipopolysaccharide/colanic/teichoic acid biosynthesis glycosyltransferase
VLSCSFFELALVAEIVPDGRGLIITFRSGPESLNPMNGFLQLIFAFQGPHAFRPQRLIGFINTRAGSFSNSSLDLRPGHHSTGVPGFRRVVDLAFHGESSTAAKGCRPSASWYVSWKPRLEFVLAFVSLILSAPVIFLAALLIKLTSRGPAIYTQVRIGKNGHRFTIYKLRTMHHQAEATTGPVWAAPDDPRVIPAGKLLRAIHLDELPQLVNVLKGDMSLIGPRPERPEIVYQLQTRIDGYLHRLAVRPGITGLAQVHLPPDIDLDGVRKKLVCDLHYIEHFGLWLDLRILLCTALLFVGVPLRWSRRLFQVPQPLKTRERRLRRAVEGGLRIEDRESKQPGLLSP